ncbi:MAG: lamin tail domain-containing protein, partial [Ignavibacteriaceae bacterium]
MLKYISFFLPLFFSVAFAQTDTTLILSEIMFYPTSGPNEFIELYNFSEIESIDLDSFKIKYSTSNPDIIIDAGEGTILPPNSFAIILEGDYPFGSGIYDGLIPPEALLLKIDNNSFGSSGMANTSDRPVWLLNTNEDTLEAYFYSANNSAAVSDEKIEMIQDSSASNWANSNVTNGTPGFQNSVTPVQFDLAMSSLIFNPSILVEGDDVTISAKVKNLGTELAQSYSIEIYNDADFDSTADPGELIFSQPYSNLQPGDSITASTVMNSLQSGDYQVIAKVVFSDDENFSNNKLISSFVVFPPGANYNDVVINEIMYSPSTDEPEWVEMYNRTSSPLNIKKWKLFDAASSVTITNDDVFIPANSFIVLTKDSSILNFYNVPSEIIKLTLPALNNSGDAVVIKDSIGFMVDSLFYLPTWGGNAGGRSLERISVDEGSNDSVNWGTSLSINKATPGIINSITPKAYDLAVTLFEPANEFGIIGEQIELNVQVSNLGLNQSQNYDVKLFRDVNADSIPQPSELISTQMGFPLPSGDSSIFNFLTNDFVIGINYFITKVETTLDDDTTNNFGFTYIIGATVNEVRNDLIINEFMYAPNSPEPEWIEIFNRSSKTINLKNYQVADISDTIRIVNTSIILNPFEYLVIADDSSIYNFYNIPSQVVIQNFSALNNNGDKIILLDSLNRTIDSLQYLSAWGGNDGRSLEKIDAELSPIDSTNWATSVSIYNGTPGYINSVTQKDYDIATVDLIFSPPFPIEGDTVTVSVKVKNIGLNSAVFSLQLFEDTNLDSLPDILITTIESLILAAGDSNNYSLNFSIENLQSKKGFLVNTVFNLDEDTTNNKFYKTIAPGFPPQSIVINEIMYGPSGGEPEWIELFNNTNEQINLLDWSITDIITTPATATIEDNIFIPPNSFIVLTKDAAILNYHRLIPSQIVELGLPSFNNDVDGVILKDGSGAVIDSVHYFNQWGGTNGYSLERVSTSAGSNLSSNWGSSFDIELSTPGRINSITPKQFDLSVVALSFDPRFPVNGNDVFISASIKNNGSSNANNFNVEFFIDTDSNNVVDQLLSRETGLNLASGDSSSITSSLPISNLTSKVLTAVRIFFTEDEDSLNNYFERYIEPGFPGKILIINEVMYNPADNESEWIELVNVSDDSINIKDWSVGDLFTTPTKNFITNSDLFIKPDEFLVIAKDTSFNSLHPEVTSIIFFTNFGTLGNSVDGIVVYDFRDGIIDSLLYRSSWGGRKGFSLERILFDEETNDSTNWTTSLDPGGSTPGAPNSIGNAPDYERNDLVINEIMFDAGEGNSDFIEFLNLSEDSVNIGGWQFEDENGNSYKLSEIPFKIPKDVYFILA